MDLTSLEGWSDGYRDQEARTVLQLRRNRRLAGGCSGLHRCRPDSQREAAYARRQRGPLLRGPGERQASHHQHDVRALCRVLSRDHHPPGGDPPGAGLAHDIDTLRFARFRHNHIKFDVDPDSHTGKLRVINDAINRWTHVAPLASKMTVLQHISWADPPKSLEQRLEDNRKLQIAIDKERALYGYRKIV